MEVTKNIVWHATTIAKADRHRMNGHKSAILWYTGLSGAGKSTLANKVEELLFERGFHTYVLDGDNVRHGLNKGLGFSTEDRKENIRRIGEVAKLFVDAGAFVSTAFISPYQSDREMVRNLVEEGEFIEVFVNASLDVCEERDPKGLYKKARAGEIKNFTGIDDPYEAPKNAELVINTGEKSLEACAAEVMNYLESKGYINKKESVSHNSNCIIKMNQPHGGVLVNKIATGARIKELEKKAEGLFQLTIEDRYGADVEMIAIGAFSPLTGFMGKADSESSIENMTLANGTTWGIPILLPAGNEYDNIQTGAEIALLDRSGRVLAIMTVDEKFELDLDNLAQKCFKTTEEKHPGVQAIKKGGNRFIAGPLEMVNRPLRHDDIEDKYFLDPTETRAEFEKRGWKTIVAFQTRNPIHRAHEYLIKCAQEIVDGALIHPIVGETKSDDIPAPTRMRCYEALIDNYFNQDNTMLSVLPTAMRYAGPREAINHTIIRKNYGCTHMIIGRDHAGVGTYYGTYEAQEMMDKVGSSIGMQILKFENTFWCVNTESMASSKTAPKNAEAISLSGTKVREMLQEGKRPPMEFSRPEVADILIEWATNKAQVPA